MKKRDHIEGPANAPVTLVKSADFECPDGGAVYPTVNEVLERLGAKVLFVYRYYSLVDVHPYAERALEDVVAQGTF